MYIRRALYGFLGAAIFLLPSAEAASSDIDLLNLTNSDLEKNYATFVKDIAFGLYFNPGNSGSPLKQSVSSSKKKRGSGPTRGRGVRTGKGSSVQGIKISGEAGILMPSTKTVDAFTISGGGEIGSTPITKLKFQVGLPMGADIGYNFSYLGKYISSSGMELRYDIGQHIGVPGFSLAARGHYSTSIVTTELNIYTAGVDFISGLDLGIAKPYLAVGLLSVRGSPSKALRDKNPAYVKDDLATGMPITIGVKIVPIRNFSVFTEIGILGEAKTASAGLGLDF